MSESVFEEKYVHKTSGMVWIILLVDRAVLGRNAVSALGKDPWTTTFNQHQARQFKSEKAARAFLAQRANDVPSGFNGYPAEITLKPRKPRRKRTKVVTAYGVIKLRDGETTFFDVLGTS